ITPSIPTPVTFMTSHCRPTTIWRHEPGTVFLRSPLRKTQRSATVTDSCPKNCGGGLMTPLSLTRTAAAGSQRVPTGLRSQRPHRAGLLAPLAAAALLVVAATSLLAAPGAEPQVITTTGAVRGTGIQGYQVFKAIPYAAPPVGELRW